MTATLIAGLFLVLSTVIPVLLSNRRTRETVTVATTTGNADVLAAVHRLEGKVDTVRENVGVLLDWKALHERDHESTFPALQVVAEEAPVAATRRRRRH